MCRDINIAKLDGTTPVALAHSDVYGLMTKPLPEPLRAQASTSATNTDVVASFLYVSCSTNPLATSLLDPIKVAPTYTKCPSSEAQSVPRPAIPSANSPNMYKTTNHYREIGLPALDRGLSKRASEVNNMAQGSKSRSDSLVPLDRCISDELIPDDAILPPTNPTNTPGANAPTFCNGPDAQRP